MISKGKLAEVSVHHIVKGKISLNINVPENGKCYLENLIYQLQKRKCHCWRKTTFWEFDEIEVSQKDAKCQLAEKWLEKNISRF